MTCCERFSDPISRWRRAIPHFSCQSSGPHLRQTPPERRGGERRGGVYRTAASKRSGQCISWAAVECTPLAVFPVSVAAAPRRAPLLSPTPPGRHRPRHHAVPTAAPPPPSPAVHAVPRSAPQAPRPDGRRRSCWTTSRPQGLMIRCAPPAAAAAAGAECRRQRRHVATPRRLSGGASRAPLDQRTGRRRGARRRRAAGTAHGRGHAAADRQQRARRGFAYLSARGRGAPGP